MGVVFPNQQAIAETLALLEYYSFELEGQSPAIALDQWLGQSPIAWVRLAVLEALYRGRYKKISVTAILRVWQKRGSPQVQFNPEFERLICAELPPAKVWTALALTSPLPEAVIHQEIAAFSPPPDLADSGAYQKLKAIATQQQH